MLNKYYSLTCEQFGEFRDSDHPPTLKYKIHTELFDFESLFTADSLLQPETLLKHSQVLYIFCMLYVL